MCDYLNDPRATTNKMFKGDTASKPGFPSGNMIKDSANAGDARDAGSVPASGRSPRVGNGNPLQYSCLENPMDRETWWAVVHRVAKSQTQMTDWTHTELVSQCAKLLQSCLTLYNPMDCIAHQVPWILQAKILEWAAMSFSRGSSWPRDWICVSYEIESASFMFPSLAGGFFTSSSTWEALSKPIVEIRKNHEKTQLLQMDKEIKGNEDKE